MMTLLTMNETIALSFALSFSSLIISLFGFLESIFFFFLWEEPKKSFTAICTFGILENPLAI